MSQLDPQAMAAEIARLVSPSGRAERAHTEPELNRGPVLTIGMRPAMQASLPGVAPISPLTGLPRLGRGNLSV